LERGTVTQTNDEAITRLLDSADGYAFQRFAKRREQLAQKSERR
jgi:hypothetical protein